MAGHDNGCLRTKGIEDVPEKGGIADEEGICVNKDRLCDV